MTMFKKVLVCLFALMMLVGCSGGNTSSSNTTTESGKASIKLGGSGPITGGAAIYGLDVMRSAQIAVDEINEKEGYEYFSFKFEDDEADPEKSPAAFGSLMDWGMQVSIYTVTSGAGAAVSQDYTDNHIFALTPSGSSTDLIYSGDTRYETCFQMCFTDPNQGTAAADYISQKELGNGVYVIYRDDDNYSTGVYQNFMAEAANVNLNVLGTSSFTGDDASDFSTQVLAAQASGADVVFLPIYYTPAAMILAEANKDGFAPVFVGVDGMDGILGLDGFDTTLAEGLYLLTPFAADASDDLTVNYVKAFEAKHGYTPNQFGADAYDCVYAIYQACKAAGVTGDMSAAEICDAILGQFTSMTFEGLTGTATWASNGEVSKSPKAVVINNGAYVSVE